MLKAQLRSKVFGFESHWQQVEDILTSDFFGVLDYLPRQPYLKNFIQLVVANAACESRPSVEGIEWDGVEIVLWPRVRVENEQVEPDVVMISNKWVIVIEVKLESGLGYRQPWREYLAGKRTARERGISEDCVHYVLISIRCPMIEDTFLRGEALERAELMRKAISVPWFRLILMMNEWLYAGLGIKGGTPERTRLLQDAVAALRMRRTLTFCGFAFQGQSDVLLAERRYFAPEEFCGFLSKSVPVRAAEVATQYERFDGFLLGSPTVKTILCYFQPPTFRGFVQVCPEVSMVEAILILETEKERCD